MAKSKSFNAAEDLLFGTNTGRAKEADKVEEKQIVSSEREEKSETKKEDQPNQPVGDKLFFIHKEAKSVRKNWLITPSNDRDLRAEAQSLGISVNELINLIFEQRYGRTRG
jgi:hypothetical protein